MMNEPYRGYVQPRKYKTQINWGIVLLGVVLAFVALLGYSAFKISVQADVDTGPAQSVVNVWIPTEAPTPTATGTATETPTPTATQNLAEIFGTCDEKKPGQACVVPTPTPMTVMIKSGVGTTVEVMPVNVCTESTLPYELCYKPTIAIGETNVQDQID